MRKKNDRDNEDNNDKKNENQRKRLLKQELKIIRNAVERTAPAKGHFLEEPYGSRRQTALLNYADKAEEEFEPIGSRSVLQNFARQELTPLWNIHVIDDSFDLRIAAAIWILDKLRANNKLGEAYQYLPEYDYDFDAMPFEFYHPCYSNELINSVVNLLTTRYAKKPNRKIYEYDGVILINETATSRKPREEYQKLLDLLPEADVKKACAEFKEKVWDLAVRRMKATGYFEREAERISKQISDNLPMLSSVNMPARIPSVQPDHPLLDPSAVIGGSFKRIPELDRMMDHAKREREIKDMAVNLNYYFSDYLLMSKEEIQRKTGNRKVAEAIHGFSVSNPYAMCFALFCLLDSGDDAPWLLTSVSTLMDYCQRILPWYLEEMDDWDEEELDEWYDGIRYDRNGWTKNDAVPDQIDFFNERHGEKNLAQIIYKMSRGVVPAGLHPFEQDRKQLIEEGMDEEKARIITGTADLLFLSQFQAKMRIGDGLLDLFEEALETKKSEAADGIRDAGAEDLDETASVPETAEMQKLKKDLTNALKQVKSYKNALAVAKQEADSERAKYEHELKDLRMEHRELADLRELVFNQQRDSERQEKAKKQYAFPYETRKRTVVFGGHDSFLRAFKPMFTNVKFVDAGALTYSPDIIRYADVVWIQNNCISHSQYWSIVKTCKRAGVQMRYFGFASAEKCAEQLVMEDLK